MNMIPTLIPVFADYCGLVLSVQGWCAVTRRPYAVVVGAPGSGLHRVPAWALPQVRYHDNVESAYRLAAEWQKQTAASADAMIEAVEWHLADQAAS